MGAYLIVEFTVKDPEAYREKYAPNVGRMTKEYGAEPLANGSWEILHGDGSLTSGALMRFPDRETVIKWYESRDGVRACGQDRAGRGLGRASAPPRSPSTEEFH